MRMFKLLFKQLYDYYFGYNNCDKKTNGELKFINSLKDLRCVFDVGANNGDYSQMILDNFSAEIHVFEPQKKCFEHLNNLNVIKNNVGVSDCNCDMPIYSVSEGSELTSVYKREIKSGTFSEIGKAKFIRLDDYIEKNNIKKIDLLKIDVEGHELSVLKGIGKYLNKEFIKIIQFEYGGCNVDSRTTVKELFDILSGYQIYRITPRGIIKIKYSKKLENFNMCNYIAK